MEQLNNDVIEQETANKCLRNIALELKRISSIRINYMDYMSALIYVLYENRSILKPMLTRDIEIVIRDIDYEVQQIRKKENSRMLFSNVMFMESITERYYMAFEKVVKELGELIGNIGDNKSILAESFEYIVMLAEQSNDIEHSNGEFYTPKGLVKAMVKMLDIQNKMAVYNPASASGNFLVESARNANIYAFGEETYISSYNICVTNLWIHDVYNKRMKEDTRDEFKSADVVLANPPFNGEVGASNTKNSYINYIDKMIESMNERGKMAIILPQGFLFKQSRLERYKRYDLIKQNLIDAVIGLPEKLFFNTKIPVIILIIDKRREEGKGVLFIDASNEYVKKRKVNILAKKNQDKILELYNNYATVENYSYLARLEEIESNGFDLSVKKYVRVNSVREYINPEELRREIYMLEEQKFEVQRKIGRLVDF